MQISLADTSGVACSSCKSQFFEEALLLRRVSRFVTGASQDSIMPIPVLMCKMCGKLCEDALAPELKELFSMPVDGDNSPEEGNVVKMF